MAVPKLVVCCSGNGSNLQAIVRAIQKKTLKARIVGVICDNPAAFVLVRAQKAKLPTIVLDPRKYKSRSGFDRALDKAVKALGADWIVLAGFMRILGPAFVKRYTNKIFNIHPSLLPAFPGAHGIRDAFEAGVKVTGVTIHFVDELVDHGPILAQQAVPVHEDDDLENLEARIHRVEHKLYPATIQKVINKRN